MTDTTADAALVQFRAAYLRLLELTGTTEVPNGLQPQFVARMLDTPPAGVVELHSLYERSTAPGTDAAGLAGEVSSRRHELRRLLSAAERLADPATAATPRLGRRDPTSECERFSDDRGRLDAMARRIGGGDPGTVLTGLGGRAVDLVALRVLAERIDAGDDPEALVADVLDRRPLLDDLLDRAERALPGDRATELRPRHPVGQNRPTAATVDDADQVAQLESLAFQDSYDWLLELTDCSDLDRTAQLQELSRKLAVPLASVIAVRTLYDDVTTVDAAPLAHVERIRASRDLLDDLLTRAEDTGPGDAALAPVVQLETARARHSGTGTSTPTDTEPLPGALARRIEARAGQVRPTGASPIGAAARRASVPIIGRSPPPPGDDPAADDQCEAFADAFASLAATTGTADLDPGPQAIALNEMLGIPIGDAAALRELADRIGSRFAPRRILAGEARARRPQLDRLADAAAAGTRTARRAPSEDGREPPVPPVGHGAGAVAEPIGEQTDAPPVGLRPQPDEPHQPPTDLQPADPEPDDLDPVRAARRAEFGRMRALRDERAATATADAGADGRPAGPFAARSLSRPLAAAAVVLIVVVDLIVIGWWLSGRWDGSDDPAGDAPTGEQTGDTLVEAGAPRSDADAVASASGDACHLVPLGSFTSLGGARDFAAGEASETLTSRSLIVPSEAVPGHGADGYLVIALGENPGDASRLADIALDSGLVVAGSVTLDEPCPDGLP